MTTTKPLFRGVLIVRSKDAREYIAMAVPYQKPNEKSWSQTYDSFEFLTAQLRELGVSDLPVQNVGVYKEYELDCDIELLKALKFT